MFVAAEFSLVSVDRREVERAAEAGDHRAAAVAKAVRTLSTQLSAAQVGITLTALVVGFIAEPSIARLLYGPLSATGLPDAAVNVIAVTIALLVATIVQMVLGELVPQNLAIAHPLQVARIIAAPQRAFATATGPLVRALNGTANRLLRLGGIEPQEELRSVRTPEELQSLARRSAELGTLSAHTGQLLERALRLRGRLAEDVMTPRVRMHAVRADDPATAVIELALRTGHSRFPVRRRDHRRRARGRARQAGSRRTCRATPPYTGVRDRDGPAVGPIVAESGTAAGPAARSRTADGRRRGRVRRNRRAGDVGGSRRGAGG
ncbi:MAG: CNNM domain-containing protein [Geodermatophilaceae bacterium]